MTKPFVINIVCTGNICRSAMAEVILNQLIDKRDLTGQIKAVSSGISDEEHGGQIDSRAQVVLNTHGYRIPDHFAHRITPDELAEADLILPMTHQHLRQLLRLIDIEGEPSDKNKVRLYRSFDKKLVRQAGGRLELLDIADPWYGDRNDFELAYEQIAATAPKILNWVEKQL